MNMVYLPPASIEASRAEATARKIITYNPKKDVKLNKLVFPFKFDRNSKIVITEELDPKKTIIDEKSLLNNGDGIEGDMISGFSRAPFKSKVVNESGRHKASLLDINSFVYAKLEKAFSAIERKYSLA